MAPPTHITVTAPPGRKTPIHKADGVDPGGSTMYVEAGIVRRVANSQTVRRAIARGDLLLCNMNGADVDSVELAAAPVDLHDAKPDPTLKVITPKAPKIGGPS
jgi:hypothetical protein